jgi:hypothetical protein
MQNDERYPGVLDHIGNLQQFFPDIAADERGADLWKKAFDDRRTVVAATDRGIFAFMACPPFFASSMIEC